MTDIPLFKIHAHMSSDRRLENPIFINVKVGEDFRRFWLHGDFECFTDAIQSVIPRGGSFDFDSDGWIYRRGTKVLNITGYTTTIKQPTIHSFLLEAKQIYCNECAVHLRFVKVNDGEFVSLGCPKCGHSYGRRRVFGEKTFEVFDTVYPYNFNETSLVDAFLGYYDQRWLQYYA